jgi:predicted AAA+ superfamily ATPase
MLRETVLQHRAERDDLRSRGYLERTHLARWRGVLSTDLIKVVTGPRRAGKSVFALQLLAGKDFAYLNFDDENLLKVGDHDELLAALFVGSRTIRIEPAYRWLLGPA